MIEINLIPEVKQQLIKAQTIRTRVITGSIIIGLVSMAVLILTLIYVFAVQTVRGVMADKAIEEGSAQLASVDDLSKTLTIQNQLKVLTGLHDGKNIDSRIFDVLGAIIPPNPNNIQISNLYIDSETKSITIEAQAPNSYVALEIFKKTIQGSTIKYTDPAGEQKTVALASNVSISDTSYGEDNTGLKMLRFGIKFNYPEELFSPNSKSVSVVVTVDGNVTDSYLGVPKSIFADRASDITEGGL